MNTNKILRKIPNHQKPIEYDIHLKYICQRCGQTHWLSINEASTRKFKVVCFCGLVFGIKRVKDFKLIYHKKTPKAIETKKSKPEQKSIPVISNDLLNQTIEVLVKYGFTKTEAKNLIIKSYQNLPTDNPIELVKQTLESLRNTNVK